MFDHHYHFDHLLDTAFEASDQLPAAASPDGVSPLSSSDDLQKLAGADGVQQQPQPGTGAGAEHTACFAACAEVVLVVVRCAGHTAALLLYGLCGYAAEVLNL